jgi:hypothetical protein
LSEVFFSLDCRQTELEYRPMLVSFFPRVREVEDAVIRPNAGSDLLVNPHALGWSPTELGILSCLMELAVLGETAGWVSLGLVDHLWILASCGLWMIVPFVDQSGPTVLDSVAIRGVRAEAHEDYGMIPALAKVHPLLETGPLPAAHFDVRDDVVAHVLSVQDVPCGLDGML